MRADVAQQPLETNHFVRSSFDCFVVSFENNDLNLTWKQELGTEIYIYDKEMAQFDILSARRGGKHPVYHSGEFTRGK